MKHVSLITVFLLVCPLMAAADESIYESLSGVEIGRVFLSQDQRDFLDRRRLVGPPAGAARPDTAPGEEADSAEAAPAGYIVGPNGHSRIWANGDFVEVRRDQTHSMKFPGEVKITRHAAAAPSAESKDLDPSAHTREAESEKD